MASRFKTKFLRLNRGDDPPEANNWRLWFAVVSFGLMGAGRGIDEGLISGTFGTKSFQNMLHLHETSPQEYASIKGNITAMVQIGCVGGALLASTLVDRIGRLWTTRELCLVWILGMVIFLTCDGRLGQIYAGRFIAGLGIGQTAVVAPVYLSEIAPKSMRGLCTCFFAASVYIGVVLAYFSTWGSSLHINSNTARAWQAPTSLHIIFAGLILILSFFNRESPRYLIKKGLKDQAVENLSRIRGLRPIHPHVQAEISDIDRQLQHELELSQETNWRGILKEIFLVPDNFYRLYAGVTLQLLAPWSGAGSITLYAQDLFALVGLTGNNQKLFVTAIFGVIKFFFAILCALFLIDTLGRKRALAIGATLQGIALFYIAAFLTAVPQLSERGVVLTAAQKSASTGAVAMIYLAGVGWTVGFNSIQYVIAAELYPLRIRGICTSIVMVFHFVFQYSVSRAIPQMLLSVEDGGISPGGTFWFFSALTIVAATWTWFSIPEMAGISLEAIDEMFTLKWHEIGRKGRVAALAAQEDRQRRVYREGFAEKEEERSSTEHSGPIVSRSYGDEKASELTGRIERV